MWLLFLQNHWKKLLYVAAMLACFAGGALLGHKMTDVQPQVKENIVEKEKVVVVEAEKKQTKTNKNTVVVTKPDGTKTETIVESTETQEEATSSSTKESAKNTKIDATAQTQYRLGVFASRPLPGLLEDPLTKPDLGLMAGYRVWGPAWAETSYTFDTKELSIGLSFEF